jgi:hypothetical protein
MHCEIILTAALVLAGQAAAAPDESADLQLQYARAKLQLAQANLNRIEEINRRVARSVPASVVAEFQRDVAEADVQVEQASAPDADEFAVWLRRAQSELQSATTRWKYALAANERLKSSKSGKNLFDASDIERFRLRAEVGRLQYLRGNQLVGAPRAAQLEWQVELLNNEVDRLKEEEAVRVAPSIRYYPIYWFW